MATIGIFNVGLGGHVRPTIRLAAAMRGLGHSVVVWAPEDYRALIEAADASPTTPYASKPSPGTVSESYAPPTRSDP